MVWNRSKLLGEVGIALGVVSFTLQNKFGVSALLRVAETFCMFKETT